MTKRRKPLSVEDGVTVALAILGDEQAEGATRKSARLVRSWSDPDDDAHHIPVYQALRLDRACMLLGEAPPILTAYRAELRRAQASSRETGDPMARLADAMAEMGDVAEELRRARATCGPGGKSIVPSEAQAILTQVAELRAVLDALEHDVIALLPAPAPVEG